MLPPEKLNIRSAWPIALASYPSNLSKRSMKSAGKRQKSFMGSFAHSVNLDFKPQASSLQPFALALDVTFFLDFPFSFMLIYNKFMMVAPEGARKGVGPGTENG